MCRGTVEQGSFLGGGQRRLEVRAFYLRLSTISSSAAPAELTLVYRPAIGGAALEQGGRALPPASPAETTLHRVRDAEDGCVSAAAYASADRVSAAEGARFEVYAAGKLLVAEGVFARVGAGGWRVECGRPVGAAVAVAEVVVLAEGGVLVRARARAAPARRGRCLTRLEGIPEEEACACGEEWEVVGDDGSSDGGSGDELKEAVEMGAWAVCVGVGLIATARRFSRKRAIRCGWDSLTLWLLTLCS